MNKLANVLSRMPRPVLALSVAGVLGALIVAGVIVSQDGAGSGPDSPRSAAGPDVGASPTPEPTTQPNRRDCAVIKGTPYLSGEEEAWYEQNCASSDAPAVSADPTGAQPPIGDRLMIPSAGVNAEIHRVTVPASGQMPDPTGYFNAVWYDFSSWPGMGGYVNAGNLVLSGHVDCGLCVDGGPGTAVFWQTRQLKAGDTAEYQTADGRSLSYVVTESRSLPAAADFASIVASGAADMTIITCTGTFTGGEYDHRYVVSLRKV